MNITRTPIVLALAALLPLSAAAADKKDADALPAPIQVLQNQGLDIIDTFSAPDGLTGYAATANGRPLTIYLTKDKQHAIIGTLLDAEGNNLSVEPVQKLITEPQNKEVWAALQDSSNWVADGNDDADRIIYMFDDPECPYCHLFWQKARPWVEAGKVQIRHVMVGIITQESPAEAAAIMAAKDPAKALDEHQKNYRGEGRNGVDASKVTEKAKGQIDMNELMMRKFGISGTPALYYLRKDGNIGSVRGMPQPDDMEEVMGSPMPENK